jgi:hypothetical protein
VPVTVQPDGTWSWTADTTLPDGPHTFTVSSSDPAGNSSGDSAPLSVTVDTVDPTDPGNHAWLRRNAADRYRRSRKHHYRENGGTSLVPALSAATATSPLRSARRSRMARR